MAAVDLSAVFVFSHGMIRVNTASVSQDIVQQSGRNSEVEMQFFHSREVTKQLLISTFLQESRDIIESL